MSPSGLPKLAALVPQPRAHLVLYKGVLAANASWRAEVVPRVPTSTEAERAARAVLRLTRRPRRRGATGAEDDPPGWAELLRRVFAVDGWACPSCGQRMQLRTVVVGPPASTAVVRGLLRAQGPPRTPGEHEGRGA